MEDKKGSLVTLSEMVEEYLNNRKPTEFQYHFTPDTLKLYEDALKSVYFEQINKIDSMENKPTVSLEDKIAFILNEYRNDGDFFISREFEKLILSEKINLLNDIWKKYKSNPSNIYDIIKLKAKLTNQLNNL